MRKALVTAVTGLFMITVGLGPSVPANAEIPSFEFSGLTGIVLAEVTQESPITPGAVLISQIAILVAREYRFGSGPWQQDTIGIVLVSKVEVTGSTITPLFLFEGLRQGGVSFAVSSDRPLPEGLSATGSVAGIDSVTGNAATVNLMLSIWVGSSGYRGLNTAFSLAVGGKVLNIDLSGVAWQHALFSGMIFGGPGGFLEISRSSSQTAILGKAGGGSAVG